MITTQRTQRVGYVLKRYPRLSETFIVNEILAHEAAGFEIDIFALRFPNDGRYHENLARVRTQVTYLAETSPKIDRFWQELVGVKDKYVDGWINMADLRLESAKDVYQSLILARLAMERRITHLHAHFASAATTVARLASRITGIPYSFTAHAKDIYHRNVRPDDLRRKLSQANKVITVSDYNLRYLSDTYGPAASNVQRIYNGLDLNQFHYSSPSIRQPNVLAVGRLVEKKGFADLITACSILASRGTKFRCDIVGDGLVREDLEGQIQEHELGRTVKMHGSQPQWIVKEFMKRAALLAAPCVIAADRDRDGLPTVLLEAMALGTPSVSTDVTGIPEVLLHGKTGLMVPQNDPSVLADAIESLIRSRALRVKLASNARRMIEEQFDIHRNARQLRNSLLEEPPERVWAQPVLESA